LTQLDDYNFKIAFIFFFAARVTFLFASVVHELRFACSWITQNKDTTVWLDGASPVNTSIPPSFASSI